MINILVTVDRIEENVAVLIDDEDRSFSLPISFFETKVEEGDVFELILTARPEIKKDRTDRIRSLFEKLKNKGETTQ